MEALPEDIRQRALFWAKDQSFDSDTRAEVQTLVDSEQTTEIIDRFYRDLKFGTGGMRGKMGAGTARMNRYNIRRASAALAKYLQSCKQEGPANIAITYDSRLNSRKYARECASVLSAYGFKVYLTAEMRPVPMLSYMVRYLNCQAGICVTASHNPKEYNGFKVYWKDGGQLVPPHDQGITDYYQKFSDLTKIAYIPFVQGLSKGKIEEIGEKLDIAYLNQLRALAPSKTPSRDLKIIYTPLHGTGIHVIPDALKAFGFYDVSTPPTQSIPDGNFPTVVSPNPEDPKALATALSLAKEQGAELILGTDPDADRAACIVKLHDGSYYTLNGNQIICLLTDYLMRKRTKEGFDLSKYCVISTIVTSPLLKEIVESYDCHYFETLTGFKWICHLIEAFNTDRITPKLKFLCGGEESFGFLWGDFVRDKDAILTCTILAEMVDEYKKQNLDLQQVLETLYQRFGVYHDSLHTFTYEGKQGADKIDSMMNQIRQAPPAKLGEYKLTKVEDLLNSDKQPSLWLEDPRILPSENVLQFFFEDRIRLSIRPSGTEPKIKLYLTTKGKITAGASTAKATETVHAEHQKLATSALNLLKAYS